jgi:hypothetical protein
LDDPPVTENLWGYAKRLGFVQQVVEEALETDLHS